LFSGRISSLEAVAKDLDRLADSGTAEDARKSVLALRRHLGAINKRLEVAQTEAYALLSTLRGEEGSSPTEGAGEATSQERERIQGRLAALGRIVDALEGVNEFDRGPEGALLTRLNSILLLGEWGTGKTHFLCDFAVRALEDHSPALVVLASSLRTDLAPLDAIADYTGIRNSGAELVKDLEAAALAYDRRAIILIDAINESDRAAWRTRLPRLVREVSRSTHLALIVSCRTPFDQSVVTEPARRSVVQLRHPGFEDQEFDAQIEFFRHYNLPALHVPLLTTEFSRPLFLRLMCEGVRNLGKRSQRNKLRDIASGQKSMTYILEHFVKRVGSEVESHHGLPPRACWNIMKGDPAKGRSGFAGVLARNQREWMSWDEATLEVRASLQVAHDKAKSILTSMKQAGLLIEHSQYEQGRYVDVLVLPYQRFSDHLVARHLLDQHLDVSSPTRLRRCFYANRRLGAVFMPDRWGRQFAEPGVAAALMVEFPERVKRLVAEQGISGELLGYLPRQRRLLYPFVDTFLDGLYWRAASSISTDTMRLIDLLLRRSEEELRARTYEVLFGLASRDAHPLSIDWLYARLKAMQMSQRDAEWSEFLRTLSSDSNVLRLLSWVEREEHGKVDEAVAARTVRMISLLLTTTDRVLRDRATRALVLVGEAHFQALADVAIEATSFNDPYVPERCLAAAYGACMRRWARETSASEFADALEGLSQRLLELVLRPDATHSTWHALTRGYAVGVLQILQQLRPRALRPPDRQLLTFAPGQAQSPFRSASEIQPVDVADPDSAIHMDFGNYTIGRLIDDRGNYDFKHPEYVKVRRQIADRMRQLGYSAANFDGLDRRIAQRSGYGRDGQRLVDRYGKKYAWVAFFEMYGLRSAQGLIEDHPLRNPRSSDVDIDPSFPQPTPTWNPQRPDVFRSSPTEIAEWISFGGTPDYEGLLRLATVDGHRGGWVLLDAAIHEGVPDGRELRGWVTSIFVPERSLARLRAQVQAGRDLLDHGFPDLGADYYTYHGEVPWSLAHGSDVRTKRGLPRRLSDRAFDYFDGGWRSGIPVEDSCRRWSWESYHSDLNQVGTVVFPAPPMAVELGLRVARGASDMIDAEGRLATIYREAPGPGFGSHFLYIRRDLVDEYAKRRRLRLVQAVVGERSFSYRFVERGLTESFRELLQANVQRFCSVTGLDE
jgi:hypothetical protein